MVRIRTGDKNSKTDAMPTFGPLLALAAATSAMVGSVTGVGGAREAEQERLQCGRGRTNMTLGVDRKRDRGHLAPSLGTNDTATSETDHLQTTTECDHRHTVRTASSTVHSAVNDGSFGMLRVSC